MKNLILLCLCFFFSTLAFSQITIKGVIDNSNEKEISINYLNQRSAKKVAIKNEAFDLTNNLKQGYYTLKIGNESASIYLSPGDDLSITLDAEKFDETISFKGEGANRNNYLVKKFLITEKVTENTEDFYSGSENDYLKKIIELNSKIKYELGKSNSEDFFIESETKSLRYDFLLDIHNYESLQDYYFGKKVVASDSFLAPLKAINYDNSEEFEKQPYYRYLSSSKWKKDIEKANGYKEKNQILRNIKSDNIKIDLIISFYYSISNDINTAQDYFDLIKNYIPNSDFTKMASEKLKTTLRIKKGIKSPQFSFKNVNDKTYSLNDFKGKYVFIDVWATWCGPCIKQMPALKELEHKYQNKEIVFVSISVDKKEAYDKWRKMVLEKNLGGIQLFANNSFDSKFIKKYGISSIPRFIIIDKEGKIYDENADKPSTELLKATLNSLLN
jgi:thiol-disulfide isomerase/thioredoxin